MITAGLLYGLHYDIHAAQSGIRGTPEGEWMQHVYAHAEKYPNEVEHTYSFVQVLTACTASFAHGANDIGPVPVWQLAALSRCISTGLITYGYNIMKVMGNKITYHFPSRVLSPRLTLMCITGATVGVGLCNGTLKAVNFQRVGLLLLAWIMTIPIAGTLGGVLMGLFLNAPHFSS
ncbi:hypothetical protein CNMCM8980_006545 [Aspergillus fumigatiaffinis]|uniref:Phosphate transporter n=1 Tax=Aspergillus fumigatiaffinis TaxID=340414 RepID=A0A8H4HJ87_9EURO|nr:hypothetical protein CNMCM5878_006102 [Aspergillus fumigatiaffinis]KAF4228830.1 hypothetical protein CNMCM8980_006545 [Aspergillus fumigatiaffinis]KAF4239718.1 hypothetical protein CNMCM6457_008638 [Aspergillus fumigatiaffinis]KAF4245592.1 hypothetical protein CNMCM6805_003536 [Aspergillus fumigatiaffinis]